jgi:methyl coenzyme M reductase alpha subunit
MSQNENTETLIETMKEVGLEVNTEKTKHVFLSCRQNARQNHEIKIANKSFEKCGTVKIFGNDSNI